MGKKHFTVNLGRWKRKSCVTAGKTWLIIHSFPLQVLPKVPKKCPWKIECFLEDLFLGSQWSIILGYIWLSVKFSSLFSIVGMIGFLILNESGVNLSWKGSIFSFFPILP